MRRMIVRIRGCAYVENDRCGKLNVAAAVVVSNRIGVVHIRVIRRRRPPSQVQGLDD
jgi:hypothetical protein